MARNNWNRNTIEIAHALERNFITKRSQLLPPYHDKGASFKGIFDIGPALDKQLRKMLEDYGPIEWAAAFPDIEYDSPFGTIETADGGTYTVVDSGETPIGE